MIEVRKSSIHGRGVFATRFIPQGTLLTCDVVVIPNELENHFKSLETFTFPWDREHYSVCFGFGSFLNHSTHPNVQNFSVDKELLKQHFKVLTGIQKNQELTISYGKVKKFEIFTPDL